MAKLFYTAPGKRTNTHFAGLLWGVDSITDPEDFNTFVATFRGCRCFSLGAKRKFCRTSANNIKKASALRMEAEIEGKAQELNGYGDAYG
jgi:hypothetical protein